VENVEGLAKVMVDLSVIQVKVGTLKTQLRVKEDGIGTLNDVIKNKEDLITKTQVAKDQVQK